jgi:hypothetical protein
MKKITAKLKRNKGAAMLISVIFFLFISLAIITGLVSPTLREFKIANDLIRSRESILLSESGAEDAYYRLKTMKPIGTSATLSLNGHTATTEITDSGYNQKTIITLGDVSSRERKTRIVLTTGDGVSFKYGIQAGVGGFQIGNAIVNGNVYSNGVVEGTNGATVTGSVFSAGAGGLIDNIDVGTGTTGDARAHTVENSTVLGNLYCQVESGNNKSCDTSAADPVEVAMPITDAQITKWKSDAELGGTTVGDVVISTPGSLGPIKIVGNLAINAHLTITGTIYVTGNITTANNAEVRLSSSYANTGGVIVTDGRVTLSNNVKFFGSGVNNTYVLLVTTSSCPSGCSGANALEILNNVGAILVNAQNGTVHLNNNVTLNEVVGNRIIIDNSATVNYTSGLANQNFTSGPSGGWAINSWQEIE